MSVINDDIIRSLAAFRGGDAPVVSCYLDVDGRRYLRRQDYETALDALLREARAQANGHGSVARDLRRIESFVKGGVDRSDTRGLAMFSCVARDLWHVVRLPVPVPNRVVVNEHPAVSPLERVLEEADRFGVLLVDRQRARMFVFELGTLTDRSELFDQLPRDYDTRGSSERGDPRSHVDALAHQHLRRAADVAWRAYQEHPFDHLSVGAPDELAHAVSDELHPYLRDRLCERFPVAVGAGFDEIRQSALDLQQRVERRREAVDVAQLREAVATGRRGVAGLGPVLDALADRRVERLLVSHGYREPGWRCAPCQALAAVGRACKRCGDPMTPVADVVEEAVEEALAQSCRVEICVGNADLDVLGRIGALLRY